MSPVRILLLSWEFTPILGGAGAFARDLCLALGESGHRVTVMTADFSSTHREEQARDDMRLAAKDVEVIRVPWPHPLGYFTVPRALRSLLTRRRSEFDRFWITDSKAQAVASKLSTALLGEYSVVIHGGEMPRHFEEHPWWLSLCYSSSGLRKFLDGASVLMGISQCTVDWIGEYGLPSRKITLGVDPATFYPERDPGRLEAIRRSFGMRPGERAVVTACRLEPDKGADTLIQAFAPLSKTFPDATIWIAGNGGDRPRLESIASSLGIVDRVRFTGALPRPRLRELIQAGVFFAMPTRRGRLENFGLVFIEANASGKAVLAGRTGGVPDAVEDGVSGLLVDPFRVEETREALVRLLSDESLLNRLEAGGERRFHEGFTHFHTARQILALTGP